MLAGPTCDTGVAVAVTTLLAFAISAAATAAREGDCADDGNVADIRDDVDAEDDEDADGRPVRCAVVAVVDCGVTGLLLLACC